MNPKKVVVTGMGVISPVGKCVADFWENLVKGVCGIGSITHFDTTDYKVKIAAEVKSFDPLQYMDKSDARRSDRFTQFALAAAAEAVRDSGIEGHVAPERLGVYIGSGVGGMATMTEQQEKLLAGGPRKVSPFFVPMMIGNMAAGSVAIRFNAQGPCLPVITACATSTNAIGEAMRAIRCGDADVILAGGSEAAIIPLSIAGFTNCMALSTRNDPASASIPFDARRDGFVMGEGAGVLVLEEYSHAVARGARIYAEVSGYGHSCDAYHITSPQPEGRGAARAIRLAAEEAGVLAQGMLYINAHGTSTPLNDKGETAAIKAALGMEWAYAAKISSTKSMTGHMLGAAGAAEAIASILALTSGILPPTIGYQEKDQDCDLDYVPNAAQRVAVDAALSISLGFGGHNACLAFTREG